MNNTKQFYVTLMIITYMKVENLSVKRDKKKKISGLKQEIFENKSLVKCSYFL